MVGIYLSSRSPVVKQNSMNVIRTKYKVLFAISNTTIEPVVPCHHGNPGLDVRFRQNTRQDRLVCNGLCISKSIHAVTALVQNNRAKESSTLLI